MRTVSARAITSIPTRRRNVRALFRDARDAERAFDALLERGYKRDDVNVVMSDEQHGEYIFEKRQSPIRRTDIKLPDLMEEGAMVGSFIGAVIGSIAAMLLFGDTTISSTTIFGFAVSRLVQMAIIGACVVGLIGGIAGALIGSRIPDESARTHGGEIGEGAVVVTVSVVSPEEASDTEQMLEEIGGEAIHR